MLYAKKLGWLHSTPELIRPNGHTGVGGNKTRIEKLAEGNAQRGVPSADTYIVNAFHLLGASSSNGMGITPQSWTEVDAFCNRSSCILDDWQADTLILMSRAYCSWLSKGKDINCFSPWDDTSEQAKIRHSKSMLDNAGKNYEKMMLEEGKLK